MLESNGHVVGHNLLGLPNFVHINLSKGVDSDLIAITQLFQIVENTRLVVSIPNVTGDNRVASPGREGTPFNQSASVPSQVTSQLPLENGTSKMDVETASLGISSWRSA